MLKAGNEMQAKTMNIKTRKTTMAGDSTSLQRSKASEVWLQFRKNKGAVVALILLILIVLVALFSDIIWDYKDDVIKQNISEKLQGPSLAHPFGTDHVGRDMVARVGYGTRYSLSIALASVVIAVIAGGILGAIAGYFGGWIENIIMRLTDIFTMIPSALMAIGIIVIIGIKTSNLVIALGITNIPVFTRITRASVMTVRNCEYIEASRAIGASELYILFVHALPNSMSQIFVQATLAVGNCIIAASSLSFIGVGVPVPTPEWGALLSMGRSYIQSAPYLTLFPGLAIFVTVMLINTVGDGLRDALDPKLKQ
ncbi:MAG: ABC transporter permease [Spirochaetales bacterium]|nr:ABC transporter permease [Spirochaetales bacterium]